LSRQGGDFEWRGDRSAALLVVFGSDRATADRHAEHVLKLLGAGWGASAHRLEGMALPGNKEHFGWRDGLAQPRIRGLGRSAAVQDLVEPGEIVLGYPDNTGAVATTPAFDGLDLGKNGSYLVLRQLEQDVRGFWIEWLGHAGGDPEVAVWLASKALGRWPNGMPINGRARKMPGLDPARLKQPLFFRSDPQGHGCPLGAHVRRANPRDGLGSDPEASFASSARHRILRRGRPYGPAAPSEFYPEAARVVADERGTPVDEPRGLMFACVCADIGRQFEFVQQTWMNNTKQAGLYFEADPIADGEDLVGDRNEFTIPQRPIRHKLYGVRSHVRTRGGGYFFLPGQDTLEWLAAREVTS
jgi:Dyp-type peroxidase family